VKTIIKTVFAGTLLLATLLSPLSASATPATVNTNAVKFEPMIVFIEPGESVSWTGMAGHNVQTIQELGPEGAPKVMTELGDDVTIKFDQVGIQVYKCTPHWGARMGGIIVVGKPENAQAIVDQYLALIEQKKGDLLPAKGLLKKLPDELKAHLM
jgi:pseudoazurin